MKKLTAALFMAVTLLSLNYANAQSTDTAKTHGWFMHQMAGAEQIQVTYRKADLGPLNQILKNNGLEPLGNNDIWINASMSHIHGKWLFEDGIGFTPVTTSDIENLKAKYNQYQVYTRVAYNFSNNADMRVYPFVGLNFSTAVLEIQDNNRIQMTSGFSQELLNSTSSKTFYQPNFGIELGGGFDYLIKISAKNMGCVQMQRNIPIGIRAGYYINTAQGNWKVDNYSLQNGPDNKQSAVFISLNIGLGYEVKKQ